MSAPEKLRVLVITDRRNSVMVVGPLDKLRGIRPEAVVIDDRTVPVNAVQREQLARWYEKVVKPLRGRHIELRCADPAPTQDLPFRELNDAIEIYQEALRRTYADKGASGGFVQLLWGERGGARVMLVVDRRKWTRLAPLAEVSILLGMSPAKPVHDAVATLRRLMETAVIEIKAAAKALP